MNEKEILPNDWILSVVPQIMQELVLNRLWSSKDMMSLIKWTRLVQWIAWLYVKNLIPIKFN